MPTPVVFEASSQDGFDASSEGANASGSFSSDRGAQRNSLQPRGKTVRELTIGRKLRELREERNLTQQEMAGKAGVPRTYISRIENARLLPGPVMLYRIADALSVEILDLLPSGNNGAGQGEMGDEPFWAPFVGYFAQLRPDDMAYVLAHAKSLAEGSEHESDGIAYPGFVQAVAAR